MISPMAGRLKKISSFSLRPGRVIGGKYLVEVKLGAGWEVSHQEPGKGKTMRRVNSLVYLWWECMYHMVFIPKYRKNLLDDIAVNNN